MKRVAWNKGKKLSQSHRLALKRARLGYVTKDYKGKVEKKCLSCSTTFRVFPYLKDKAKLCSKKCRILYVATLSKGEKNSRWKGGYDRKLTNNNRRRVVRLGNGGFHSFEEWKILKAHFYFMCPSCLRKEPDISLTRDHIVPLSKGGTDDITNIQPLCRSCNSKKRVNIVRFNPIKPC